jgi:hypothetical protein
MRKSFVLAALIALAFAIGANPVQAQAWKYKTFVAVGAFVMGMVYSGAASGATHAEPKTPATAQAPRFTVYRTNDGGVCIEATPGKCYPCDIQGDACLRRVNEAPLDIR